MTSTVPADEYFLEIEARFAERRNTPFILSAKDWALMKKWRDDGVPLPVVLEAIDQVFENNETSGRRKVISSLSYCRHSVKELWNDRKDLYAGGAEPAPEEQPGPMLDALAERLQAAEAPPAVLEEFAAAVRALVSEKTVPRIEERLIAMESELMNRIMDADPVAAAEIREELARAIGDPARLDEKTRQRTEEANLRRIVRTRYGLPRLTLFR